MCPAGLHLVVPGGPRWAGRAGRNLEGERGVATRYLAGGSRRNETSRLPGGGGSQDQWPLRWERGWNKGPARRSKPPSSWRQRGVLGPGQGEQSSCSDGTTGRMSGRCKESRGGLEGTVPPGRPDARELEPRAWFYRTCQVSAADPRWFPEGSPWRGSNKCVSQARSKLRA